MNNETLSMKYPSGWWQSRWREAVPLGNGIVGASVYGGVWQETVMLTHTDLWWKGTDCTLPDVSSTLPEIRKSLLEDRPFEADRRMTDELKKRGYAPRLACPLPLCDFKIRMKTKEGFRNYLRTLDMASAEASVTWEDGALSFARSCFVSYADDLFVMKIEEKSGRPFSCELSLEVHELEDAQWYHQSMEDFLPQERENTASQDGFLTYAAKNDDGTEFGAVARVAAEQGEFTVHNGTLVLTDVTAATVLIRPFIKSDREAAIPAAKAALRKIDPDYAAQKAKHEQAWRKVYFSSQLDLQAEQYDTCNEALLLDAYQGEASVELLEKMWKFGRYLLAAASREGGNPCSLYGLWCGEYCGHWAFNMVNENLQMIYWQALSGNMTDCLLPVFDYVEAYMEDFRENARKLFGCRGIFIPGPTCPGSGLIKTISPHILYWTGGAGWVGQHYYDYYLCTRDEEFLKNRAIPYLKEVALFYEDFFVLGSDGFYMTIPSNSPENSPGNYWDGREGMGIVMETTMNATMDFAIAKEVLTHLIAGCEICGVEGESVPKWKKMLARIPAYQLNEDGAVREWMHPFYRDNYRHRHQSHLYPLFPGNEVHAETDQALYDAFLVALKKRLQIGLNQQTGWSLAHMANNFARMRESELSVQCLDLMTRACVMNNLFTCHNDWRQMGIGVRMDWAPVQLDANMGFTAAINEMLIQSYEDTLLILPALPARFRKGSVKDLLSRQGVQVSMDWDQEEGVIHLTLENPHAEQKLRLLLPRGYMGEAQTVVLKENETQTMTLRKIASAGEMK